MCRVLFAAFAAAVLWPGAVLAKGEGIGLWMEGQVSEVRAQGQDIRLVVTGRFRFEQHRGQEAAVVEVRDWRTGGAASIPALLTQGRPFYAMTEDWRGGASRKSGAKVTLGVIRNGKKQDITVTVADRAKLFASRLGEEEDSSDSSSPKESKLGLSVRAVTSDIADRLDIPAGKGIIVQDVKPGSFADDVGLSRGDVILEINKQPVNSEDDFTKISSTLKSGQDVVFLVRQRGAGRQDGTIFLAGTLP